LQILFQKNLNKITFRSLSATYIKGSALKFKIVTQIQSSYFCILG
jgi:hypothetical protein